MIRNLLKIVKNGAAVCLYDIQINTWLLVDMGYLNSCSPLHSLSMCTHVLSVFSIIFENLKVALNPIYRIISYPAYQNSMIRKNFTVPFLKYKRLKVKLRLFLAGYSVAMVTYCVTKIIPTCPPVFGQFLDTMIAASIDKEWLL